MVDIIQKETITGARLINMGILQIRMLIMMGIPVIGLAHHQIFHHTEDPLILQAIIHTVALPFLQTTISMVIPLFLRSIINMGALLHL